jgi:hypothetical protein
MSEYPSMSSPLTVFEAIEHLFPADRETIDALAKLPPADAKRLRTSNAQFNGQPYEAWPSWPAVADFELQSARRDDGGAIPPEMRAPYAMPPLSPFDLFAATGHLLELSGAYHHIMPGPRKRRRPAKPGETRKFLIISERERAACQRMAAIWRNPFPNIKSRDDGPKATRNTQRHKSDLGKRRDDLRFVMKLWDALLGRFGNFPVHSGAEWNDDPPPWWRIAILLFIIADEAAQGAGFELVHPDALRDDQRLWFMVDPELELVDRLSETQSQEAVLAVDSGPEWY